MYQNEAKLEQVWKHLPDKIRADLALVSAREWDGLEEIRLRLNRPILFRCKESEFSLRAGNITYDLAQGYHVTQEDIHRTMLCLSEHSLYAFHDEIKQGYITIPGGHRVGLAGQAVMEKDVILTLKHFNAIAFRIARACIGCGVNLLSQLIAKDGRVKNTLLISPPQCGKTTILRDITRMLSDGGNGYPGLTVSLVDERSELAGTYQGLTQMDVGARTDVLDGCPKAVGMMMAIRALSPQLLVTDEIGRPEDISAIQECNRAGVTVFTTTHGSSVDEVLQKPGLGELLRQGAFHNLVVLSRRQGPGTIEEVVRWNEFRHD